MIYYKTTSQVFDRYKNLPAYVIDEDGQAIIATSKTERVVVPVHQYTCDPVVPLENRPDLYERAKDLAHAKFATELEMRLKALLEVPNLPMRAELASDPNGPLTLIVVETEPENMVWAGNQGHASVTFGVAAFCWSPEDCNLPADFEKVRV